MLVSDEDGDIEMKSKEPSSEMSGMSAVFFCLPSFITSSATGFANVDKKDAKNFVVEAAFSTSYPNSFSEACEVTFSVWDKAGARSNELKTKLNFK
jgi:hypothetical protein